MGKSEAFSALNRAERSGGAPRGARPRRDGQTVWGGSARPAQLCAQAPLGNELYARGDVPCVRVEEAACLSAGRHYGSLPSLLLRSLGKGLLAPSPAGKALVLAVRCRGRSPSPRGCRTGTRGSALGGIPATSPAGAAGRAPPALPCPLQLRSLLPRCKGPPPSPRGVPSLPGVLRSLHCSHR